MRAPSIRVIAYACFAGLVLACGTLGGSGDDDDSAIAARIGDDVLTVAELDEAIKEQLFARETGNGNASRLYTARSRALEDVLTDRVLEIEAERRGTSVEEMVEQEFPLAEVSDAEVEAFYSENASRLQGATFEQVAPDIRVYLQQRERETAIARFVDERTEVVLERERVSLRPGGPSKGPADAPVTIVEFSDFQCPYCERAIPVMEEIRERHPENVRVVYRHLPLDGLHPRARAGAEAAACAEDGGKFWEYHDLLFANRRALGDDDLMRYAEEVGLDTESFAECIETRRHAAAVQADVLEAQSLGITGTPAFVVNGIVLFGLQSVDALDEIVREELAREDDDAS